MSDREYNHYKELMAADPLYKSLENNGKNDMLNDSMVLNAPEIRNAKIAQSWVEFQDVLKNSNGEAEHVARMQRYSEYTEYVENNKSQTPFQYSVDNDVVYYNPQADYFEAYDLNFAQAHELSHRMDVLEYNSTENRRFKEAIEICKEKVMSNKEEIQTWFDQGGKYENDFAFSDIISALSHNEISVDIGHPNEYWDKDIDNIVFEIFANVSSIDVLDSKSKIEFDYLLKELYEAYRGIVK